MKRPIRIEGDIAYVPLTKGYEAIIDVEDVPLVEGWNWSAREERRRDGTVRIIYAGRNGFNPTKKKWFTIRMHQAILPPADNREPDHADCNGLNNRRHNLRLATKNENQHNRRRNANNTTGAKGVSLVRESGKYRADIQVNGVAFYLGRFDSLEEASRAYVAESRRLHGAFGRAE